MTLLCRHWQTVWNVEKRQQWQKDSPLTNLWLEQWVNLWKELKQIWNITGIHSSPLGRANITAQRARGIIWGDIKVITNDLLKELSFWIFEWKDKSDRDQEPYKSMLVERVKSLDSKFHWRYPEGESYLDVESRVKQFLIDETLLSKDVIVAHEAINRMILKTLLNLSIETSMIVSQPNDVIYKIDWTDVFHKKIWTFDWDTNWNEWLILKAA